MKNIALTFSLFLFPAFVFAQSNDKPNRDLYHLSMVFNGSDSYQTDVEPSPCILPGNVIHIYTGETLYIEVEMDKKKIISMKSVKENVNPKKTLIVKLTQVTSGKGHVGVMLSFNNPFKKDFKYTPNMLIVNQKNKDKSSWVKLAPKLAAGGLGEKSTISEMWPDFIVSIKLEDPAFKKSKY